jgi:hypothetical protein
MSKYRDFQKMLSTWFNTLGPNKGTARFYGYKAVGKDNLYKSYIALLRVSYSRTYYSIVALVGKYKSNPDPDTMQDIYNMLNKSRHLDQDDLQKIWDLLMTQPHYELVIVNDDGEFLQQNGEFNHDSEKAMTFPDNTKVYKYFETHGRPPGVYVLTAELTDNMSWQLICTP